MDAVNTEYFCNKFVPEEEDRGDRSWRVHPGSGEGLLKDRSG